MNPWAEKTISDLEASGATSLECAAAFKIAKHAMPLIQRMVDLAAVTASESGSEIDRVRLARSALFVLLSAAEDASKVTGIYSEGGPRP